MSNFKDLLGYKPAKYHSTKSGDYIDFLVINPTTQEFKRVRTKINHIAASERKAYGRELVKKINLKLKDGWNPLVETTAPRGTTKLIDASKRFLNAKKSELRPASMNSYVSFINTFSNYLITTNKQELITESFQKIDALQFIEYVQIHKDIKQKTLNNYLTFYKAFWGWLLENKYVTQNVFTDIRKKKSEQKERVPVSEENRTKIEQYLSVHDPKFLLVCKLVYHALLRPKEITFLKPSNFNLNSQTIYIPGAVAKNHKNRIATIPDALMNDLLNFDWNNYPTDKYLFGNGIKPMCPKLFTKKWSKMRIELKLPKENVLYSLRDTGIIQMLRDGISPAEVQKQADHSSLDITSKYLTYANPQGSEQIKKQSTNF
jgi:integrase